MNVINCSNDLVGKSQLPIPSKTILKAKLSILRILKNYILEPFLKRQYLKCFQCEKKLKSKQFLILDRNLCLKG